MWKLNKLERERDRERYRSTLSRIMIGIKHKNVIEHGRHIIFFLCGLKNENIYFNVMGFLNVAHGTNSQEQPEEIKKVY